MRFFEQSTLPMISRRYYSILLIFLARVCFFQSGQACAQHLRVRTTRELCNPDSVSIGKQAPDIKGVEYNGTPFSLASMKGKYVLIQVWSSAISKCRAEIDAWQKMKADNVNPDIEFLGISVDKDVDAWKLYYDQNNLQGAEIHADALKPPLSYFLLSSKTVEGRHFFSYSLPQYILIDPKGIILDGRVNIKPSDITSFSHFLNNLPGI